MTPDFASQTLTIQLYNLTGERSPGIRLITDREGDIAQVSEEWTYYTPTGEREPWTLLKSPVGVTGLRLALDTEPEWTVYPVPIVEGLAQIYLVAVDPAGVRYATVPGHYQVRPPLPEQALVVEIPGPYPPVYGEPANLADLPRTPLRQSDPEEGWGWLWWSAGMLLIVILLSLVVWWLSRQAAAQEQTTTPTVEEPRRSP